MIELKEGEAYSSITNRFITLFKYIQYNSTISVSDNNVIIDLDSVIAYNIKGYGSDTFLHQLRAVISILYDENSKIKTEIRKLHNITIQTSKSPYELAKEIRNMEINFNRFISNQNTYPYKYYLNPIDKRNISIDEILTNG